jgi:hypothetical protein
MRLQAVLRSTSAMIRFRLLLLVHDRREEALRSGLEEE